MGLAIDRERFDGNSPTFLGHQLGEETRVALFKQAVDDRDAAGRSSRRVSRYLDLQRTGDPVHTWPLPAA
jgi:hypothetical protein